MPFLGGAGGVGWQKVCEWEEVLVGKGKALKYP